MKMKQDNNLDSTNIDAIVYMFNKYIFLFLSANVAIHPDHL